MDSRLQVIISHLPEKSFSAILHFNYTRDHSSCGFLVPIMDGLARHNSNVIVALLLTIIT